MSLKPTLNIDWVNVAVLENVPSPSVLLGLDVIDENLRQMLAMTGGPERLRPHVKTHKLPQLVQRQRALGIKKFKCATIAEAEMCAQAGAPDVLLAYPMVGPNIARFLTLQKKYPETKFSTIVDDAGAWKALAEAARREGTRVEVLVDVDVGQHRTGIAPGPAGAMYREIAAEAALIAGGLHAYDGHLTQPDPVARAGACATAFAPVMALRSALRREDLDVPRIVAGGSPTFPFHAAVRDIECSPGTAVLWDASQALTTPDLPFHCAAALLTRVVSKPLPDHICLDLGHKAVASEMPHPRVIFPGLPEAEAVKHSEEHLLLRAPMAVKFAVGDMLLGVPWHVCPTLALHAEALIVEQGRVTGSWPVQARARKITV